MSSKPKKSGVEAKPLKAQPQEKEEKKTSFSKGKRQPGVPPRKKAKKEAHEEGMFSALLCCSVVVFPSVVL